MKYINIIVGLILSISSYGQSWNNDFKIIICKIKYVPDLPDKSDITQSLTNFVANSSDGDVIVLPQGKFILSGQINVGNKQISILGYGADSITGTMLYLNKEFTDNNGMFYFRDERGTTAPIFLSGIYLKSVPALKFGGHYSTSSIDFGARYWYNTNYFFTDNIVQYFSIGLDLIHLDSISGFNGLIFNNKFLDIYRPESYTSPGYGIIIQTQGKKWISDPEFGSDKFVYIEDNYFRETRHAVATTLNAKYVARYNIVEDNWLAHAFDLHGGNLAWGKAFSARAAEIYSNTITNKYDIYGNLLNSSTPPNHYTEAAISVRGGEALVYSNSVDNYQCYVRFLLEEESPGTYPSPYQIGYKSALQYGSVGTGYSSEKGSGDAFTWNPSYKEKFATWDTIKIDAADVNYLKFNRDIHKVVKPGYIPNEYPNQNRNFYYTFIDTFLNKSLNVNSTKLTSNSTKLFWNNVLCEDGYYVYQSSDNANYKIIGTTGINDTTFIISGLSSGTNYWYYIQPYNDNHLGKKSTTITVNISPNNNLIPVTNLTITGANGSNQITANDGTLQLSASILPVNASEKTVTWSLSSGTGKASISSTGLVTALTNGTVIAQATAKDGSGVTDDLVITISNQIITATGISVASANSYTTIGTQGGKLQLTVVVSPANVTNKSVTWSAINGTGQATINSSGLLTAVANGTVTAKATANDGSGVSGIIIITISNQTVMVTGISVSGANNSTTIITKVGVLQLTGTISPTNAANKAVTWSMQNGTGQATISTSGLVAALSNGTVTATATSTDGSGVKGSLVITISGQTVAVTGINITGAGSATTITTNNGTLKLTANVTPSTATNKSITWTLQNGSGQASINVGGLVTAISNGTVTATATATDGSGVKGSLVITISGQTVAVTNITVTGSNDATTITSYGGILQLSAIVLPDNATNKTINWAVVKGTGQASIDAHGLVTAISDGTVTVKATATDNSEAYGSLIITIMNQAINNNAPVINNQQFTIQESTFTNNYIGTVTANDIDPMQNLNFTIISGNESGIFAINFLTGEITTVDNNIFGTGTLIHKLIVRVTDNADKPQSASAIITVEFIGRSSVIYIDPDNTGDFLANGSVEHPFNSWNDITWKEGNTYLQKRGTETTTNKILIGANKVSLGAYGEGELPVIYSETNSYLICGFEKSGIKIRNLNLQATNAVSCIYFLGNSGDSIIVEHCELNANANAIKVVDGNALVTKYNTITSNHEGISSTAVSNEIYYNIFKSCNTAVNIISNISKANIYNNVFFDNEKSLSASYAELTLYNNIFYMTTTGQMAINQGTGKIKSDHNIFYPEQDGFITIANISFDKLEQLQKELKIDMNSFNKDPLFIDIYNENFSLEANSPAINAGVDLMLGFDLLGNKVPLSGTVDIGIIEFAGAIIPSRKPNEKSVMTLYPNPSSGQINILAEINQDLLPKDPGFNQPEIQVLDISGNSVFTLLLENQNTATIQENIDLSGISNGLYFVVLHIKDKVIKEKLIIYK